MRFFNLVLILAFGGVAPAQVKMPPPARPESFPAGSLDARGLVAWEIGRPLTSIQQKGLKLLKAKHYGEAIRFFRAELQRDPSDLLLLQGFATSHARGGDLNQAVTFLNAAIAKFPKKVEGLRVPQTTAPMELQLGLFYAEGMRHFFANRGSKPDPKLRAATQKGRSFWFEPVDRVLGLRTKDRVFSMMYIQALDGLNRMSESRIAVEEMLRADPKFHQLRLIYSSMLLSGTDSITDSKGNELPVPAIEKKDSPKGLRMAEMVIRDEPKNPLGYYFAGVAASHTDKAKAKRYLNRFLEMAHASDPRRAWAKWRLQYVS